MNTIYAFTAFVIGSLPFLSQAVSPDAGFWERIIERYGFPGALCIALSFWIWANKKGDDKRRDAQDAARLAFEAKIIERWDRSEVRLAELSERVRDLSLASEIGKLLKGENKGG